ncbi:hypothetical protein WS70_22680 [Burkholderia mayonis]|uniref:Uncharacterized protein n=1 Tax=Burkholderia mayonis TaxID=1385591 RepID=A0A1B4FLR8_9BURK|nr:hypothetical protein WS70_22680 [Burkholderia mayonis]KVE46949.1 hypothetical protein WS70_28300 [Burkholderia mayonis]
MIEPINELPDREMTELLLKVVVRKLFGIRCVTVKHWIKFLSLRYCQPNIPYFAFIHHAVNEAGDVASFLTHLLNIPPITILSRFAGFGRIRHGQGKQQEQ